MATAQPLVCASLHLPPDPQPFLRIHEISLHIFLPNLDRLRLALEATRDVNPEAAENFHETRKVLREELLKALKVLQLSQEVAERYYKVLEALEKKKPTQRPLYEVGLRAEMGMISSKEAQQAMSVFRKEFEKAVDRVTTTTGANDKKGSKSPLTSAKNIQSVSEILSAIDECNGLLQQCHSQFERLVTQTQNENSIDSDPPSEEETQVMRGKWQTYFDTVKGVWIEGIKITDEILFPSSDVRLDAPGSRKPRQKVPLWRALFQRKDNRELVRSTNVPEVSEEPSDPSAAVVTPPRDSHEIRTSVINEVDAIEGLGTSENTQAPNATPANGLASNNPKAPFWRKVFRRTNRDNSNPPPDASTRPEASDGAPDAPIPPAKVPFWRKLSRYATCLLKTPFR